VTGGGTQITNKRKLIDAGPGTPDGMRCDVDGNLWVGWGMGDEKLDGVAIFNPDGKQIGRIALPARCANLCFGGTYRNRLFHDRQHRHVLAVRQHPGRSRRLSRSPERAARVTPDRAIAQGAQSPSIRAWKQSNHRRNASDQG
jgi:sugar lactone lactonase YvrE